MAQKSSSENENSGNENLKNQNEQNENIKKEKERMFLIEVTDKNKESIQNIPVSISAFTKESIEDKKIEDVHSLSTYIPNYQTGVYNPGFVFHAIRGQSNITQASSPIGIYVDDIPLTASQNMSSNNPDLFALERIEIFRGPQGNLYGLNSSAGAIHIITRKPSNKWQGNANITAGNYHLQKYSTYVSGPIAQNKLYLSVGGTYKRQHAYIRELERKPYQESRSSMRINMLYTPMQNVSVSLTSQVSNSEQDYMPFTNEGYFSDPYLLPKKFSGKQEYWNSLSALGALNIRYTHEKLTLLSVTSFQYSNSGSLQDLTIFFPSGTPPGMPQFKSTTFDSSVWTQEMRFSSSEKKTSPLQWLMGFFYSNTKMKYTSYTVNFSDTLQFHNLALFAQTSHTFFEKLTLRLGLRYDMDYKLLNYDGKEKVSGNFIQFNEKKMEHSVSPKFALSYQVRPPVLLYVSFSQGVQTGGFNRVSKSKADSNFFKSEYNWTTEIGAKTTPYKDKIFLNISGFYTYLKNAHIFYSPEAGTYIYENAPKAQTAGAELEFTARPVSGLEISLAAGYLYSQFIEHTQKMKNKNRLPLSPDFQLSAGFQYVSRVGIYLGCDLKSVGLQFFEDHNMERQNPYMLMDAKFGYMNNHFQMEFWIDNMFNKTYYGYRAIIGKPRTYGGQISVQF